MHIRLSHTHNNIPGLADYTGEVDPRRVTLAITPKSLTTLRVQASTQLRFEHLTILYGGIYSRSPGNLTHRVRSRRFWTSTYGVGLGNTTDITFSHCQFNGGMPPWYFRTDRKAEYTFLQDGRPVLNNLGKQTISSLIAPSSSPNTGTTIHHCEFHNAHDLYLGGSDLDFHHNWINNLNDEGIFLDAFPSANVRIHENVILKTLSPLSFAGGPVGQPFYIYRNVIDVRAPTAGYRPRHPGDVDVWRYGNTFKSNGVDGPTTCSRTHSSSTRRGGQASYLHYRDLGGAHPRRSFNNIFVAVNPDADSDRTITFLPSPAFPGPTDANLYHRMGERTGPLFRHLGYTFQNTAFNGKFLDRLADLHASVFFQQSQSQYAPGYEAHSLEGDPQFQRLGADGHFRTDGRPALAQHESRAGKRHHAAARPAHIRQSGHGPERRGAGHRVLSVRQRPARGGSRWTGLVSDRAVIAGQVGWLHRWRAQPRSMRGCIRDRRPHAATALSVSGGCPRRSGVTPPHAVEDGPPRERSARAGAALSRVRSARSLWGGSCCTAGRACCYDQKG